MGKVAVLLNGLVLSAVAAFFVVGSQGEATPVVRGPDGLAQLEADVAKAPTASALVTLTSAYLERNQPGLAQAVLDGHPERLEPEVTHARARVAFARGQVDEALGLARLTRATCDTTACPSWLVAKNAHQLSLLEAMQAEGVTDPASRPDAARAVLERSSREVRLVAMR